MKGYAVIFLTSLFWQCSIPPPPSYALPEFFNSPEDSAIRVGFYNLENLFDTVNDPEKEDDDFTPKGANRWNYSRYSRKIKEHGQTLRAMGGWSGLDIIGLAEIENRTVVEELASSEPLKALEYKVIHFDSPDPRGIDVALIWRGRHVQLDTCSAIAIEVKPGERPLRDMLWARFTLNGMGLHVIVAHWPSRYGGQLNSEEKRVAAAHRTNELHDQIKVDFPGELIIFMGDLNDEPHNKSLKEELKWAEPAARWSRFRPPPNEWPGSHVHKGKWSLLDQCYISKTDSNRTLRPMNIHLFPAKWLLEKTDLGDWVPFRTYLGPAYHGGSSDHIPFYFDISTN